MEKGGLKEQLEQAKEGLGDLNPATEETKASLSTATAFSDEMRLGLIGQVRRVLAPRGVKVVQPLQREYQYEYLMLAVLPLIGKLLWEWMPRMKQVHLVPILQRWSQHITCNIWDGAGVHRGKDLHNLPGTRIIQPAYSPELNPAERVFQEVRRHVEGKVYSSLADKRQAVEDFLQDLAAQPVAVKQLCFWPWIREALCVT